MNEKGLHNSFRKIDEDTGFGKEKSRWIKWGVIVACLCLVASVIMMQTRERKIGGSLLPGAEKIYPTVMVQGELYQWRKEGRAIWKELPENCVYYGEVVHVKGKTPKDDCEFVSVFSVEGQIYISQDEESIYLCLTTDWLDNTIVVFDFVENGLDETEYI